MERYLQLKASPFKAGDGFNSFQMLVFGGALLLLAVRVANHLNWCEG
jgi:hypothetical protein